jgi:hypothetical protein
MNKDIKHKILNQFEICDLLNSILYRFDEKNYDIELEIENIEDIIKKGFSEKVLLNNLNKVYKDNQNLKKDVGKILKLNNDLNKKLKKVNL